MKVEYSEEALKQLRKRSGQRKGVLIPYSNGAITRDGLLRVRWDGNKGYDTIHESFVTILTDENSLTPTTER